MNSTPSTSDPDGGPTLPQQTEQQTPGFDAGNSPTLSAASPGNGSTLINANPQQLVCADHEVLPTLPAGQCQGATVERRSCNLALRLEIAFSVPPGYEIIGTLGRGGMGVVYHARQTKLNREVALKVILSGGHSSDVDRNRFLAEAEAIASLNHPGIVQVYEFGTHAGQPYFALEYCPGGSLAKQLDGTPLPAKDAATLFRSSPMPSILPMRKGLCIAISNRQISCSETWRRMAQRLWRRARTQGALPLGLCVLCRQDHRLWPGETTR